MKNKNQAFEMWRERSEGMNAYTSLCWVDPDTAEYKWYNHKDDLNGMDKVVGFILQHRQLLDLRGHVVY